METNTTGKIHILRSDRHEVAFNGWAQAFANPAHRVTVTSRVEDTLTAGGSMSEADARTLWKSLRRVGYAASVVFEDGIESSFSGFVFEGR